MLLWFIFWWIIFVTRAALSSSLVALCAAALIVFLVSIGEQMPQLLKYLGWTFYICCSNLCYALAVSVVLGLVHGSSAQVEPAVSGMRLGVSVIAAWVLLHKDSGPLKRLKAVVLKVIQRLTHALHCICGLRPVPQQFEFELHTSFYVIFWNCTWCSQLRSD